MSHDDGALLDASRTGDPGAASRLINRRQRELVRLAYLLTGDSERAIAMASEAFIALLGNPPEELDDPGEWLALSVVRQYLKSPARSTWLEQQSRQSYTVDDDRSRIKGALDRLDPAQRATLALHFIAGVSERTIQRALDVENGQILQDTLEQARSRIAVAGGRSPDGQIIDLLNQVLVDAPTGDLRPDIEPAIRRAWSARRRSERLLTAAVLGGLVIVIAGSLVWLTGFRPSFGEDEAASGAGSAPTALAAATADSSSLAADRASFAAAPTLAPLDEPAVSIRDLQILRVIEQTGGHRSGIDLYDPALNASRPLLDAGESMLISPDGKWIVSERDLPDERGQSLLAAATLDESEGWEITLASPSSWAIGVDRLYVLNLQSPDGRQIQSIDLATGGTLESWPVKGGNSMPSSLRWAMLVLSPDEHRLALLTARTEPDGDGWYRTLTIYDPETGDVLGAFDESDDNGPNDLGGFNVRNARKMPNEYALYSVVEDEQASVVRMQFLDLDTGATSSLILPIEARSLVAADRRGESEVHVVPSNTGALLYVIQSRQRQVTVVDMRTRSVAGVFPLAASDAERGLLASNLNHVTYMEALLSPDGAWMYLAANRERNMALNSYPLQSPVWVINTTTWEVAGRWMVTGMPRSMTMSGNGARIYLRTVASGGGVRLTSLDTSTGEAIDIRDSLPAPEWADARQILSVSQIFHEQHGFRPQSSSIIPRDNPILSVLPGVLVEAEPIVSGAETLVTARIVHPVTGEPAAGDDTVRFDPGATVALDITNGDRQAILILASVEPGVYQGRARLDMPGKWDARVTIISPDGSTLTVTQPGAIEVAEGLVAANGSAYRFKVRPGNPVNRRTITLRVWMVESRSGERLPEEIELLDQIVDDAEILLTHPSGERVLEPLVRLEHASFLGWARFGAAGEWTAEIRFSLASGERVAINAGTIEIKDLTAPFQRSNPGGGAASTNAGNRMAHPAGQ